MRENKRKPRGMPDSVTQGVRVLGMASGRQACLYLSEKVGGIAALEAPMERTVCQLGDLDPRVKTIRAQPFTVDVVSGALFHTREELLAGRKSREKNEVKQREYTPDFAFTLVDGRRLAVEAKHAQHMGSEDYWEKVTKAERILRTHGWDFLTITMDHEPDLPLVQNAELLTAFSRSYRGELSPAQVDIAEQMLNGGPRELREVCQYLSLNLREAPVLILSGLVSTDLRAIRLGARSQIKLAKGDLSHVQLLPLEEPL